jgi:hypothetical protein
MFRKRHFEVFVGGFQLAAAVSYSACLALGLTRFALLTANDWHQISDIMTETYVCLVCIHLMGLRSEEIMMTLRYTAFAGCWIAKLADGWGSVVYEVALLIFFAFPPCLLIMQAFISGPLLPIFPRSPPQWLAAFLDRRLNFDNRIAPMAMGSVVLGSIFFAVELIADTELRLFQALAHCAFGAGTYFLWKVLPCYDKSDEIPMFR